MGEEISVVGLIDEVKAAFPNEISSGFSGRTVADGNVFSAIFFTKSDSLLFPHEVIRVRFAQPRQENGWTATLQLNKISDSAPELVILEQRGLIPEVVQVASKRRKVTGATDLEHAAVVIRSNLPPRRYDASRESSS